MREDQAHGRYSNYLDCFSRDDVRNPCYTDNLQLYIQSNRTDSLFCASYEHYSLVLCGYGHKLDGMLEVKNQGNRDARTERCR